MAMKEHEKGIEFVESILDKEAEELHQSKRQHHTDWDNHILMLSTASLGFTFSFLPIASQNYVCLLHIGIISFIISICFATANYIIADLNFNYAHKKLTEKLLFNTKLKQALFQLNKADAKYKEDNDETGYITSREKYESEVDGLFNNIDFDEEIRKKDKYNQIITILNHLKTYAFILGIIGIVIFSFNNIEAFTK